MREHENKVSQQMTGFSLPLTVHGEYLALNMQGGPGTVYLLIPRLKSSCVGVKNNRIGPQSLLTKKPIKYPELL